MTNILIVEDHRLFGETLEGVLRAALAGGAAMRFSQAASVAEAVRLVSEEPDGPFDLAVVELLLPDGDGTEVVTEIKERRPGTRVLVLSADQNLSRALASGADETISKTTGLHEIIASVARLINAL